MSQSLLALLTVAPSLSHSSFQPSWLPLLLAANHDNKFQFYLVSEAAKHPCHRQRLLSAEGREEGRRRRRGVTAAEKKRQMLHLLPGKRAPCVCVRVCVCGVVHCLNYLEQSSFAFYDFLFRPHPFVRPQTVPPAWLIQINSPVNRVLLCPALSLFVPLCPAQPSIISYDCNEWRSRANHREEKQLIRASN